jgi:PAT family beta-lactamase induction signal transducer AmpG
VKKLLPLLALYFAEGLPFGFQVFALPLLIRERGGSLEAVGFVGLLSAPWLAKALWAPLVDRYGNARFGRRKSWIVPLQAAIAICAFVTASIERPELLFAMIFLMNLFAATMDVAVDGLAVSWLEPNELGPGNAAQVAGYKIGMLIGGGLLVWGSAKLGLGWSGVWIGMGVLLLAVLALTLGLREPPPTAAGAPGTSPERMTFGRLFAHLRDALRHPATAAVIAVVMTYKVGESLADRMWKPMLLDRGFATHDIVLWTGMVGMVFSTLGSSVAGMLARAVTLPAALLWTAALRSFGTGGQLWLSLVPQPTAAEVIAVTCFEDLVSGAITTIVFALMMRHTDRAIGGTHFTLLATLEVWGKTPLGLLSGVIAAQLGYAAVFGLGTGLCVAFAMLAFILRARLAA